MRRIFEPWAYGAGPLEHCLWNDVAPDVPHPPARGTIETDVAVIGGGYTGLSAALHLAQAGTDVRLFEAERIGWGASGRSGGFCCLGGGKVSNAALTRRFGDVGRAAYRRAEMAAVDLVADLIDRHGMSVDRHSNGETVLAHTPRHWDQLREWAGEVTADYGVTPQMIPRHELRQHGMNGPFHGAMTVPVGFALNPRAYVQALARAATGAGARLHEQTAVTGITRAAGRYTLTTAQGRISARRLVIATNGYSAEDVPDWMRARTLPFQSNILATRPLTDDELAAQGWTTDQMAYDTRTMLHYFRLLPDRRFLFGMRGGAHATTRSTARLRARIHADFRAMFPTWAHVEVPYLWSGLVCFARDATPFVGPIPNMPGAFAGFAYHGNGVAMGTFSGRLLADLVLGRTPDLYPDALAAVPAPFPLGRYRRLVMAGMTAALSIVER